MRKTYTTFLSGLAFALALPFAFASGGAPTTTLPGGRIALPKEDVHLTVTAEIRGTLTRRVVRQHLIEGESPDDAARMAPFAPRPRPSLIWEVTANGKTYVLDLSGDRVWHGLAELLEGKTVRVVGRLETWVRHQQPRPGPKGEVPAILYLPVRFQVVVVSEFGAVAPESVAVDIRGTLRMNDKVGLPPTTVATVRADGNTFVLDFAGAPAALEAARKLDGQPVRIKGSLAGSYQIVYMTNDPRRPEPRELPVVRVAEVTAGVSVPTELVRRNGTIVAQGTLAHDAWGYSLRTGERVHRLDFRGGMPLSLRRLVGRSVIVIGQLESPADWPSASEVIVVTGFKVV
jgi:hypothetical protein